VAVKADITSLGEVTVKFTPEVFFPSYMLTEDGEAGLSTPTNSTNTAETSPVEDETTDE